MNKRFLLALVAVASMFTANAAGQNLLWYDKPAQLWLHALPVGNSHLGAMVYGGTDVEEIQLNEETFWSGSPHDNNSPEAKTYLQEVRDSIFAGKEEGAHAIIDKHFIKGPHGMRFLPLGSMKLNLGHKDVTDYRRELTLDDALNTTRYTCHGVTYERTVFASQADNVIVVQMKASKKGALSFEIGFDSQLTAQVFCVKNRDNRPVYELAAVVDGEEQEGVKAGLKAECRIHLESDGQQDYGLHSLKVANATTATLYVVAATNFVNYHDISGNPVK